MQKPTELESAVSKLGNQEYAEFKEWFWKHDNERRDAQIEKDISGNKPEHLASGALEDYWKPC